MFEKHNVQEVVWGILNARTEQDWEVLIEKCTKILPMFENKEEKIEFFQSVMLEIISEYSAVLTGNTPQSQNGKLIIPL